MKRRMDTDREGEGGGFLFAVLVAFVWILNTGCVDHWAAVVATRPVEVGTVRFESDRGHVRFEYPASWHPVQDDTLLTLVPVGETAIGTHTLAVDMPDLPLRIPGLIPLGLVENGFVADVKNRYKEVVVDESAARIVDGLTGRQVFLHGMGKDGPRVVKAFLCVRGDHVYVIDAETDAALESQAQEAYLKVVGTIQWMD